MKRRFIINFHVIRAWSLLIWIIRRKFVKGPISLFFEWKVNCHIVLIVFWNWIQNGERFIEHRSSRLGSFLNFLWAIWLTISWSKRCSSWSFLAAHSTFKNVPSLRITWNSTLYGVLFVGLMSQIWILRLQLGWTSMKWGIPLRLLAQTCIGHDSILCWFWKLRILAIQICWVRDSILLLASFTHQGLRSAKHCCLRDVWNVSPESSGCESWSWTCFLSLWVLGDWTSKRFLIMMRLLFNLSFSAKAWRRPSTLSSRLWGILFIAIERAKESMLLIKHVSLL